MSHKCISLLVMNRFRKPDCAAVIYLVRPLLPTSTGSNVSGLIRQNVVNCLLKASASSLICNKPDIFSALFCSEYASFTCYI